MEIQITDKYYEHTPESVINANGTTIMWDVPVITDQTILANRPDRVLHDKKTEDVPTDRNDFTHIILKNVHPESFVWVLNFSQNFWMAAALKPLWMRHP